MKTLLPRLAIASLLLSMGCSDGSYEFKGPFESGMSIRIKGDTRKRIDFHIVEYRIDGSGQESLWQSGNSQVSMSNGERFNLPLAGSTDGFTAGLYVPFDDEIHLEVVSSGKVIESKTSNKAGTILILELGKLPKDREQPFSDREPDPSVDELRASLSQTLKSKKFGEIKGFNFVEEETRDQFVAFMKEIESLNGPPTIAESEYWILAPVEGRRMVQGALRCGEINIPVIFGVNTTDAGKSIGFIVVVFEPGGNWTPITQWRDHINALREEENKGK